MTDEKQISERLLARTIDDGGCLVWQGACSNGCPSHRVGKRVVTVRRTLFTALIGPLHGKHVVMTCTTPKCINPDHIAARTRAQIARDLGDRGLLGGPVRAAKLQIRHRESGRTRLTPADVIRIRSGTETGAVLAEVMGVSEAHIYRVRRGLAQRDYSSPFAGLVALV